MSTGSQAVPPPKCPLCLSPADREFFTESNTEPYESTRHVHRIRCEDCREYELLDGVCGFLDNNADNEEVRRQARLVAFATIRAAKQGRVLRILTPEHFWGLAADEGGN